MIECRLMLVAHYLRLQSFVLIQVWLTLGQREVDQVQTIASQMY